MDKYRENIINSWIVWHFYEMPQLLFLIWKNFLYFAFDFFSIPVIIKTFFSPWRRLVLYYPKSFSIEGYYATFVSNLFSRFIGMIARSLFIIFGLAISVFVFLLGLFIIVFWILMPAVFLYLLFYIFDVF